jgi:subtilisin family serine protease
VRYAGPDWIQLHPATSQIIPNDTRFAQQWNLANILASRAWDFSRGSPGVVIAIVDSGCDLGHADLLAKYVPAADRRDVIAGTNTPQDRRPRGGHGTLCAGVAAADTDNNLGVAGVGWNCSIMPICIIDANDRIGSEMDIVIAINWAQARRAGVVSMSWSWNGPHANADVALANAHAAGVLLVAAAGNCRTDLGCTNAQGVDYPASHPNVMAVGASDQMDRRVNNLRFQTPAGTAAFWSSRFGPELSVVAPGDIPWTTTNGGGFGDFWGTSAAAPHVAGLAGLLLSLLQNPVNVPPGFPRNDLVRNIIELTATKVSGYRYTINAAHPNGRWNNEVGYGRINAAAALHYAFYNHTISNVQRVYSVGTQLLLELIGRGFGVRPPGEPPVPVDPGWPKPPGPVEGWPILAPEKRDVLLGLAACELAEEVDDPEASRMLRRAGRAVIERAARRIGEN